MRAAPGQGCGFSTIVTPAVHVHVYMLRAGVKKTQNMIEHGRRFSLETVKMPVGTAICGSDGTFEAEDLDELCSAAPY